VILDNVIGKLLKEKYDKSGESSDVWGNRFRRRQIEQRKI
jgi:hypothetical protein